MRRSQQKHGSASVSTAGRRGGLLSLFSGLGLAGLLLGGFDAGATERPRIAVFDFELADGGVSADPTGMTAMGAAMLQGRGPDQADRQRLTLVTGEFRRLVAEKGQQTLVDLTPMAGKLADAAPLHKCNGCGTDLAREAGADLAVFGRVKKLTPLLIHIDITVTDVAADRPVRTMSVDVNGDTDESWTRGVRWLFRNRFADPPLPLSP